jgi:HEAT repeat protein
MENEFRKSRTNGRVHRGLLARGLILACALVMSAGCEEPQKIGLAPKITQGVDINDLTIQAYRIILESLSDKDPAIRANAIEVVAQTGLIKLVPKVQRLLEDEFAPVRFVAALAIGDLEYSFGARGLQRLFKDPDSNVKIAACYGMVKLGSVKYREVLRRAIGSTDQTVRANAAYLLGKSRDRDAIKLLYWAMLDKDSADKVKYQTAESIATLGDERIFPKLYTMLLSISADVRLTGIRAMGALGTQDARYALIRMLSDKVLEVRLAAAEQLGMLNDPSGEPEVMDVFNQKLTSGLDPGDRERVNVLTASAIGRIATPNLMKHLPQFLTDESKTVRIAAARAVLQSRLRN